MKLLVTGSGGQLGWELARSLRPLGAVVALPRRELDLAQPDSFVSILRSERPDVIVNAAAYTAVDKAEQEELLATRVNGEAVGVMAAEARALGALLVHFSTDYVFDGSKAAPYLEEDSTAPLNAYGRSKRFGELALEEGGGDWVVLRSTWIYGARGTNFLRTMLRLAREREELTVVADQIGAPTSARWLAETTAFVVDRSMRDRREHRFRSDIYHCSAAGRASWFDFASAIITRAREELGPEIIKTSSIKPIPSSAYPVPALRPKNSLLNMTRFTEHFGLYRADWHAQLDLVLDEIFAKGP